MQFQDKLKSSFHSKPVIVDLYSEGIHINLCYIAIALTQTFIQPFFVMSYVPSLALHFVHTHLSQRTVQNITLNIV